MRVVVEVEVERKKKKQKRWKRWSKRPAREGKRVRLVEVDGVGEIIAVNVVEYFRNEKNKDIVDRLIGYGLQMSLSEEQQQALGTELEGMSIVISGVFSHHSRDEYKLLIEQHGGKNIGSISAKTSFILAGDNMGPAKLQKAEKLGIKIVSEEEFLDMINDNVIVVNESEERNDAPASQGPVQLSLF